MRLRSPIAVVLALCPVLPCAAAPQQTIPWRSGPVVEPGFELPAAVRAGEHHVLVQLDPAPGLVTRRRLARAGITLQRPLGSGAFFASVSPTELDAAALAEVPSLRAVLRVRSSWKLHPDFAGGAIPGRALVEPGADPIVAAYVLFHPDAGLDTQAVDRVEVLGGRVRDVLETVHGLVVEIPASRIGALAAADPVQWIEPPLPPMSDVSLAPPAPFNDSNRSRTQADVVQAGPYGLDGSGVTVLVYDGGTALAGHNDFGGRLTVQDGSGLSSHATHVSGTIGGDGSSSGGTFRGMAPAVTLESYGFQYDGSGIFLYTNPGDIESDYDEALNTLGADVANNSIGTNTETNNFNCNIQGDYGVCASVIDAVVRGSLGSPFRVVWANGNERQGDRCDVEGFGDFYSTAPPATAKNHITVGALNSNDDSMTWFSSWGPTDDGRMKPDVSAPGCQTGGDGGVTSSSSSGASSYSVACGTSMASPTTAGLVSLLLEDHRAQFGGPDPLNSTVKVLLAHTAVDRGDVGPDYEFGYGSVRIQDAIDFMRLGRFREDVLPDQGASYLYTVSVGGGDPELRLTLAWDDVPGTPNVFGALVNDLDLVVRDPSGARQFPWTLDPSNPGAPPVRTQVDRANNIEQVLVASPAAGTWTVEVHGFDLPAGPQTLSLASSHALTVDPFVQISFPGGLPVAIAPGAATTITAEIAGVGDTVVGGSPTLHYRYDGGAFQTLAMSSAGGDLFQAALPPAACSDTPELYVSAQGVAGGTVTNPTDAPGSFFQASVEETTTVFSDDFETDLGWTVTNISLSDGPWGRGIPVGGGDRNDPANDFDGSGRCYLTDNVDGNSDVDGGPTRLTSPVLDLSGGEDYRVRSALWFANEDFDADALDVEITGDGSTWIPVASFGNTSGWVLHSFRVADFVAPTATVQVRFDATDNPNDSVAEAALDAFEVFYAACVDLAPVASFTAVPASGVAPLAVSFTDTSSGDVTGWSWDLGDGTTSTVQHPSHSYDFPGAYDVALTVTGPLGADVANGTVTAAKPPAVGTPYGTGSPGSLGALGVQAHGDLLAGSAFYLVGSNLPPGTQAYLALSVQSQMPTLDLSNGLMLNLGLPVLVLVPKTVGVNGEALLLVYMPGGLSGISFFGQAFALDGVAGDAFASSTGLQIDVP